MIDRGARLERFADPDFWHRPANYWFWHRLPTDREIAEQLQAMVDAGYGSFQVAVRMSWPLADYLSDDYLAAVRRTADRARELGLHMGIYDDYNWLSGHAGGRTVAGHDELRESHLFWSAAPVFAGRAELVVSGIHASDVDWLLDAGARWVFEGGRPEWASWEIQGAYLRVGDAVHDVTGAAEFLESGADGVRIAVRVPQAVDGSRVEVAVSGRCVTSRMINYLEPAAAERFARVGLQPYVDALGDHVGTTVAYAFFDQPHACFFDWTQRFGSLQSSLMYSPALRDAVDRELPGGWRAALPALIGENPGRHAAVYAACAEFFGIYARLGTEAFFGTLRRWCHDHGLLLTGHEVLAHVGSWDLTDTVIADDVRGNFGMDYFAIDAFRDVTAVDARNVDPQLAAKFGDSVARAHGRTGCILEQYFASVEEGTHFGAGQWELTLRDLRSQAIRHHLLGARQFLEHAFWLTDGDDRDGEGAIFVNPRLDFPPGVNFEPWFDFHGDFARESASLSQFLDEFEPDTDVALVYPLTSIAGVGPTHPAGRHFAAWAETMSRHGVQYRIVAETALATAESGEGTIRMAGVDYLGVVLAGVESSRHPGVSEAVAAAASAGVLITGSGPTLPGLRGGGWIVEVPSAEQILASLAPVARPSRPRIVARDGRSLWLRTGCDGDGTVFLVAFNDGDDAAEVVLELPEGTWALTDWSVAEATVRTSVTDTSAIRRLDATEVMCLSVEPVEIESIVLDSGWTLTAAGASPRAIRVDSGWEQQGVNGHGAVAQYRLRTPVPAGEWDLVLDGVVDAVEVRCGGELLGRRAWPPYRFALPDVRDPEVALEIAVAPSAAERYYAGSSLRAAFQSTSGLTRPPRLERRPGPR